MSFVLVVQLFITLLGAAALALFVEPQCGASFATGGFAIALSFFLMTLGYGLIFQKKMIALAVGIIVFKYAILGIIIFTLIKLLWFNPLWFSMGVASLILSAIAYALKESLKEGNNDVI